LYAVNNLNDTISEFTATGAVAVPFDFSGRATIPALAFLLALRVKKARKRPI
jgi:hypothetical protein